MITENILHEIKSILTGIVRSGLPVKNATDSAGTTIENINVTTPPTFDMYVVSNIDESSVPNYVQYVSGERGKNIIQKITDTSITYYTGTLASASTSWTNRATLTYTTSPIL